MEYGITQITHKKVKTKVDRTCATCRKPILKGETLRVWSYKDEITGKFKRLFVHRNCNKTEDMKNKKQPTMPTTNEGWQKRFDAANKAGKNIKSVNKEMASIPSPFRKDKII